MDKGTYQVTVLSGVLKLAELRIADSPPVRNVSLNVGQSLDSTMVKLFQTGSSGCVPVPVEKQFPIR